MNTAESQEQNVSPNTGFAPTIQQGIFNVNIMTEEAEGGAMLMAMCAQTGTKKTAVISGDPSSTLFQRRLQRRVVKWMKEFFPAPPRKNSKAEADAQSEAEPQENDDA